MSDRITSAKLRSEGQNTVSFEMAYQIRVPVDEIRFAIRASEAYSDNPTVILESRMQLLDALERLQSAERHFMRISRNGA